MDCNIKISGAGDPVNLPGTLDFTDSGFRLKYFLDGDECELSAEGLAVFQSRRGLFGFDVSFKRDEETSCRLHYGGFCGSLPVKTLSLSAIKTGSGAEVKIKYLLGGEEIKLMLSAKVL